MCINQFKITKLIFSILLIGALCFLGGCKGYLLDAEHGVEEGDSVILIDLQGKSAVNYVQLGGVFPAINLRFEPILDDIVAVVVPSNIKGLEFNCFAYDGRPVGHVQITQYYSKEEGYIPVKDTPMDVMKPGIYFMGTLDTDTQEFTTSPDADRLALAKRKYKNLFKNLEPINFSWPN